MTELCFFLPLKPKPKGNAKELRKRRGKLVIGNPQAHKSHQAALRAMAGYFAPNRPFQGPVRLDVAFCMPIPTSWPKWKQEAAEMSVFAHTSRPDRGNLLKMVEDALQGVIYSDDSHVIAGMVEKRYASREGYDVRVSTLDSVTTLKEWKELCQARSTV